MPDNNVNILENVSVVVPSRNRGETLCDTLVSIAKSDPAPREIIVADQSDPELRKAAIKAAETAAAESGWPLTVEEEGQPPAEPGRLRLVLSKDRGASRARNTGARAARGEIAIFTDDDSMVETDWVKAMAAAFDKPDVWGAYGRVLPYKAERQNSGAEITRTNMNHHVFSEPTIPWYLGSGQNMAFRLSYLLGKANGLDEIMCIGEKFKGFEDIDAGYRALIWGGKVAYTPDSLMYHNTVKTFPEQLKTEAGYGISVGAATIKYWRCGDKRAWPMFATWVWQMAFRRLGAGLLKWRSLKVVRLALVQFVYPFVGLWMAKSQPVDKTHWVYQK